MRDSDIIHDLRNQLALAKYAADAWRARANEWEPSLPSTGMVTRAKVGREGDRKGVETMMRVKGGGMIHANKGYRVAHPQRRAWRM